MIYPVKLEFKIYPSGAWEDWSRYLSEPPSISRKVESDNPGEAGLIVYDKASVMFYYAEGNPVYTRFNDLNLAADKRYMFRISALLSNKTYKLIFEGMADFSTIEWPESESVISFEIVDKLSALAMLQSKAPRGLLQLDADLTDSIRYDIAISGQFLTLRKTVDGDPVTPINPYAPGSIICRNHPSSELNKFYLVKRVVPKTITVYNDNGTVAGTYDAYEALIFNDLSGYSNPPNTEDRHYYHYLPYYFNIDIGATQTVVVDGNPTEELIAFDGIKLIQALIQQQWSDISLINKTGADTFNIPLSYFEQLIFEQPFNSNPLEALKFLANTMNCYLFINSTGQAVIQSRNNLLGGTERNITAGRLISATKKYFWDKLVDGINITAKSCLPSTTDNFLQGSSSLTYRLPNSLSSENIIPKNAIDKEVIAASDADTQEELDAYANQVATEYMLFYGKRHDSIEYEIELNDETVQWDLIDHIVINNEAHFFDKLDLNLSERTLSLEAVKINGADYDLRQIAIALSDKAYASSGSGGSSYTGGYSGNINPYLWDGSSVVNPGLGRQSLGLNIIANLGDGIIGNTEFNYLDGVTSNIQTQLNSKENILSFTDPLVRSGSQISITRGSFNLGANSNGFTFSGSGKPVGGDIALNFPQRLDAGGIPQFNGVYAGFADIADNLLISGAALADSERNVYAGRIGVGGEPDFTNYIFKAYGSGYFTGNIIVDGDIYLKGRIDNVIQNDLYVIDKNIILNRGGDNTTAVNAGIKVEGASASVFSTLLFDGTNWTHSHDVNTASGKGYKVNNSFAIDSSRNFFGANATLSGLIDQNGAGVNTFAGDISSDAYLSGYFGMGFKFWRDTNGANGELDNLVIRNSLRTHIFQKDIVRATNGYLFISDASEISADTSTDDSVKLIYCKENVFQVGDLLWYKDADETGGAIIGIKITITAANGSYTLAQSGKTAYRYTYSIASGSGIFKAGGTIVRIGSSAAGRQGSIYFDASSPASPFMDIYDGVAAHTDFQSFNKLVYRAGNLSGITDPALGALSGYGVYTRRGFFTEDVLIGGRSLGLMQGLTALFHFDDNLRDSISGINASYTATLNETAYGLVTSSDNSLVCTKVNGKFGGAVAIEEATTNLITNGGFEAGGSTGYSWWGSGTRSIVNGYHGNGYYMESTSSAVGLSSSAIAAVSGTTYTIQIKVKGDHLNYFYILKASGNVNISALASKTYLEGGWYQLTYTVTCTATETWNILFAFYNNAKGVIDEAQVEAKSFATSFVESSRPAGIIEYNVPYLSDFTIAYYLPNEYKPYNSIRNFLEAYSPEGYSILIRNGYNNDFQIEGTNASGTYASGWSVMTGLPYTNPGSNWNNAFVVIRKTGPTVKFGIFYNGVFYERAEYTNAGLNFLINRIKIARGTGSGRFVIDELMMFNRALSKDEIKRIYYSGQPLQESPGMTFISGNRVRTGYLYSENWKSLDTGTMFDLNKGILEMNFGGANIFKFDSAAATANIAGWGFTYDRISKVTDSKAIYLISSSGATDLFGMQMDLHLGDQTAGRLKWLSVGRIRRGNLVTDNYGFGIFDGTPEGEGGGKAFFESSVSPTGVVTNIIAGFNFDSGKFYNGTLFVLDAVNKKLYFNNKSTFASAAAGVFLGLDSGAYKFAIGDASKYLKWDGANLTALGASITGSTITGGTFQTATSGRRVVISTADYSGGTGYPENTIVFFDGNGTLSGTLSGGEDDSTFRLNVPSAGIFNISSNYETLLQVARINTFPFLILSGNSIRQSSNLVSSQCYISGWWGLKASNPTDIYVRGGDTYVNTTTGKVMYYTGSAWVALN